MWLRNVLQAKNWLTVISNYLTTSHVLFCATFLNISFTHAVFKELVSLHPLFAVWMPAFLSLFLSSKFIFCLCLSSSLHVLRSFLNRSSYSLSLLVSYLNSLFYFFVFVFLYLFMCFALFLIVYPLGNNMELPRKSKTMTRTWCILFLALSPSCYSPSVLHVLRSFLNR